MNYCIPSKYWKIEELRQQAIKKFQPYQILRDKDKFIAEHIFKLHTAMRYITSDPECGEEYEVQSLYENPSKRVKRDMEFVKHNNIALKDLTEMYNNDWEECQKNKKELCVKNKGHWDICPFWSSNDKDASDLIPWIFSQPVIEVNHFLINPYFNNIGANDKPHNIEIVSTENILGEGWTYSEALVNAVISFYEKLK
jgi:hypothetical protein